MVNRAERYIKRFETLDNDRASWKSTWGKVGEYIHPLRADINADMSSGVARHTLIFDDTAQMCSDILVAGFFSHLSSPYMPWMGLVPTDRELLKDQDFALALQDREQRMYMMYARSNFYNAQATFYSDLININHAIVFIDEDKANKQTVYTNVSPKDAVIAENRHGEVDTVLRKIQMTASQADSQWPGKAGKDVTEALNDNKQDKKFSFLHCVQPRKKHNPQYKDSMSLPFESVYISMSQKEIVDEGGFHEFPYVVTRWDVYTNDVYGPCPGIKSLNNVKTLNKAMELLIKQAEVQLDPPLQLTSGFKDRIRTSKGGLNVKTRKDDSIEPIITVGRIEISKELIADLREQIKDDYYTKAFVYLADLTERMTAYEVSKREAEKMMMLGPVIGRVLNEGLNPNVARTYNIMERGGYFAPLPEGYEDVDLEIEYLSPLARAQKAVIGQSIDRLVAFMAPLVQLYPEVADNFNADEGYRTYSEIFGVPKNVSNGLKEIQAMRAERAKLQQEEVIRQQMLQATQGIKSIADADKAAIGDQSILAQMMGGA
jgi:hypothetical protein